MFQVRNEFNATFDVGILMELEEAKYLAAILIWADKHGINVYLFKRKSYTGNPDVTSIRFSNEAGNQYEYSLFGLANLKEHLGVVWKEITMKLVVSPPEFLNLEAWEEKKSRYA